MSSAIEVLKGLVEDSEWEAEHLVKQVDGRTANRIIAERDALKEALGGKADVVLSDMAAPTTGHGATDHIRIMALAETAWMFAEEVLAPGGVFVCKVFQGGTEGGLLKQIKTRCSTVRHAKPPASRKDSAEVYVIGTGFKGH